MVLLLSWVRHVYHDFDFMCSFQLLKQQGKAVFVLFTKWGRIGDEGQHQQTPFQSRAEGVKEFCKVFKSKTGNAWNNIKSYVVLLIVHAIQALWLKVVSNSQCQQTLLYWVFNANCLLSSIVQWATVRLYWINWTVSLIIMVAGLLWMLYHFISLASWRSCEGLQFTPYVGLFTSISQTGLFNFYAISAFASSIIKPFIVLTSKWNLRPDFLSKVDPPIAVELCIKYCIYSPIRRCCYQKYQP